LVERQQQRHCPDDQHAAGFILRTGRLPKAAIQPRDTSGSDQAAPRTRPARGAGTVAHRVEWTPPARRDIARLPPKVALAVITYVNHRLAENPHRHTKPLSGELPHLGSARNGDYRILFRLDDPLAALWIIRVDHRAHACRAR
jgi:mRNA interferase RelE/StbE